MTQPNLVVIMTDQHARRLAGCYGDRIVRTPNLDALAARGTVFEQAYCNAPLCCPSRMSFLTARHPYEINVLANSARLDSEIPTFAHALNRVGYDTILCGRMHFNGPDQRHGFAERIFPDCGGYGSEGMLKGASGHGRGCIDKSGPGKNHHTLYDQECVAEACRWLRARNSDKPFLLVVGLVSPHTPLVCGRELFDYYHTRVELPQHPAGHLETQHPYLRRYRKNKEIDHVTDAELRRCRAAYYGMVEETDAEIGKVLAAVKARADAEQTAVVYTSDHGEMAGWHGLWTKQTYYEDSAGVPLIVSWPGRVKSGVRMKTPVSLVDLGPTLAAWSGADPIPFAAGISLASALENGTEPPRRPVFAELLPENTKKNGPTGGPSRMMVLDGWKCNVYHEEGAELYDLTNDPGEERNLAGDPAQASRLAAMEKAIRVGWDPAQIVTHEAERVKSRQYIAKAPSDPKDPPGSQWKGPADYGYFEPV